MEMLLTGQFVGCDEAVRAGLLNSAVDGCVALEAKVAEAATQIAARSQLAIRMGKSVFYHQCELPLEDAYALAGSTMVQNMLTHDAEEGVAAFLEKRAPDWRNC
jgi:enoyl-CoA hydratase/carnithine racemase